MSNRVVKNAGWIIGCKIVQSLINFVIGILTARYLGPSNYGIINYVASVVSFVIPIMQLGLRYTLVREFIKAPEQEGRILGTSLVLNLISGLACVIGSVSFVALVDAGDRETLLVCVLYSLSIVFQATDMIQYWFQAKLLSKYPSLAALGAYVVVALYKVYLLVTQKSVVWFAFSHALDFMLISAALMVIYRKLGGQRLSFDRHLARQLLSRSKHYIIPGLMVMVFQHTDRIMIKLMLGEAETGIYSAAITCIGITGFVYAAVIDSARPAILVAKDTNRELYRKRVVQLYSFITYMALAQSVAMTVLAKPIVLILFGEKFAGAAGVLCVAVWYVTFSELGSVRNIWILAEQKQKYLLGINVTGALANVILNLCLIPVWGAVGAAVASIVTQFFTNVIMGFVFKPLRPNNQLLVKGLNPKNTVDMVKEFLPNRKK